MSLEMQYLALLWSARIHDVSLVSEDFSDVQNRVLFDDLTKRRNSLGWEAGGADFYVSQMNNREFTSEIDNCDKFINEIYREKFAEEIKKNTANKKIEKIVAETKGMEPADRYALIENKIAEAKMENGREFKPQSRIAFEVMDKIESGEALQGVQTGLGGLDIRLTYGGLPRGLVTIVGAASSKGKSSLANLIANNASRNGNKICYVTLEDSAEATFLRSMSRELRIDNSCAQKLQVSDRKEEIKDWMGEAIKREFYFVEDDFGNSDVLCSKIATNVKRNQIDLVVLDYLQLFRSGRRVKSKQEDIDAILEGISTLARRCKNTAFLVVSQLSRTNDFKPSLSKLYHSDAIGQCSHTTILLWRPSRLYQQFPNYALCILEKQKNGVVGEFVLGWNAKYCEFYDADERGQRAYLDAIAKLPMEKN